jgi:hypothetical protein
MTLNFDPSVSRTPILGMEIYPLALTATSITTPIALTTATVITTSGATQRNGSGFSFTATDDIEFYIAHLGVNIEGKPVNGTPSPVFTFTTGAIGEGVLLNIAQPAGVTGSLIFMKLPSMSEALLAAAVPANATQVIIDRLPSSDAFSLSKAIANAEALYTTEAIDLPPTLKSPTVEYQNSLIEREFLNAPGSRDINSSMIMIAGSFAPVDIRLKQAITGGGRYTQEGSVIQGGSGYIAGACQYPLWVKFVQSANSCGKRQHNLMVATFATDSTTEDLGDGNIPFTLTQQNFLQFKGIEPVPWVIL